MRTFFSSRGVHGSCWVGLRRFFDLTHMGRIEPMGWAILLLLLLLLLSLLLN